MISRGNCVFETNPKKLITSFVSSELLIVGVNCFQKSFSFYNIFCSVLSTSLIGAKIEQFFLSSQTDLLNRLKGFAKKERIVTKFTF